MMWNQKGVARHDLTKKWMRDPDVASVTAQIITSQQITEPSPQISAWMSLLFIIGGGWVGVCVCVVCL